MSFNPRPSKQNLVDQSGAIHVAGQCSRVNESHKVSGRKATQLGFVGCHELAISALSGLIAARLGQQLVPSAHGQDRSEGKEPCIALTDGVGGESNADADQPNGDVVVAHLSSLGADSAHQLCVEPLQLVTDSECRISCLAGGEVANA